MNPIFFILFQSVQFEFYVELNKYMNSFPNK